MIIFLLIYLFKTVLEVQVDCKSKSSTSAGPLTNLNSKVVNVSRIEGFRWKGISLTTLLPQSIILILESQLAKPWKPSTHHLRTPRFFLENPCQGGRFWTELLFSVHKNHRFFSCLEYLHRGITSKNLRRSGWSAGSKSLIVCRNFSNEILAKNHQPGPPNQPCLSLKMKQPFSASLNLMYSHDRIGSVQEAKCPTVLGRFVFNTMFWVYQMVTACHRAKYFGELPLLALSCTFVTLAYTQ